MTKEQPRWLEVLKVALPLCLSYIPIGLACGVLLHAAGFNTILTGLASMLVFSGGAQFLIASMLTANAPMYRIAVCIVRVKFVTICSGNKQEVYLLLCNFIER